MARDPLANVVDAPLFIVPRVLDDLRSYRAVDAFDGVADPSLRTRLAEGLDGLVATLLEGVERHPTKFWVLSQFRKTLEAFEGADEARGRVSRELEKLMDILGIRSSDGVLGHEFR